MLSLEHKNDYFYLTCNRGKSQGGMKIYADFTDEEKAENVNRKDRTAALFQPYKEVKNRRIPAEKAKK